MNSIVLKRKLLGAQNWLFDVIVISLTSSESIFVEKLQAMLFQKKTPPITLETLFFVDFRKCCQLSETAYESNFYIHIPDQQVSYTQIKKRESRKFSKVSKFPKRFPSFPIFSIIGPGIRYTFISLASSSNYNDKRLLKID